MVNTHPHYAILGDGRLARHMRRYLDMLGLTASGWSRRQASDFNTHPDAGAETRLQRTVEPASHVLLLVADDAIAGLLTQYPFLHERRLVHCAGALSLPGVAGAHPLMTFARRPYALDEYQRIPFLVDEGHSFASLMPGLPNPAHCVSLRDKGFYHALCVVAGNFPQILWRAAAERLETDLAIPGAVLGPYLDQTLRNFLAEPGGALSGPLSRGDQCTIERNLAALQGDALLELYQAVLAFHGAERKAGRAKPQRQEKSS